MIQHYNNSTVFTQMSLYLCRQHSNDFMRLKIIMLELIIVNSQDVFEYFVGSEESAYLLDDNNK